MSDAHVISDFLQRELIKRNLHTVTAVEAARWLDNAKLLKDSKVRPGLPLRDLLRAGRIGGQRQEPNGRWFIDRTTAITVTTVTTSSPPPAPHAGTVSASPDHLARLASARQKYRPATIKYLLIAESPPSEESGRFFYFEKVAEGDSLFWQTMKALYPQDCPPDLSPPRHRKREFLERFKGDGFYLLDAVEEPLGNVSTGVKRRQIEKCVPRLIKDVRELCGSGTRIVLISAPVYEVCAAAFAIEGFNVVNDEMIDFPGSGGQKKFREKFRRVLAK